jgi:Cys/Met metabolism PLP-dependent enzyme
VGKRHWRQNANVFRNGPQFPMLSGVERPGRLMNMVAFVPTNLESDESWNGAGDDVVRLSIGLETADDLIRDLNQALGK